MEKFNNGNILNYIRKNRYILLINLIIFIFQIIIISHVGMLGSDDYIACSYYNFSDMNFAQRMEYVKFRITTWNSRIGEIIYFGLGAFPNVIFFVIDGLFMIALSNLIVYHAVGNKKYSENKPLIAFLILLTYIMCITVYPGIADSFLWMGGICNHLPTILLILIILIPFRNKKYDKEDNKKIDVKFILYLLLCFVTGFGSEAAIATTILSMFIFNIVKIIKTKKISIYYLCPLIMLCLGYLILFFHDISRTELIINLEKSKEAFEKFKTYFFNGRCILFLILIILSLIYIIKYKFTKELLEKYILILISSLSILPLIFFAYYYVIERAINIFNVYINITIIFILYELLKNIKLKVIIIMCLVIFVYGIFLVIDYIYVFHDYNEYKELRDKYVLDNIDKDIIYVPAYDHNKNNILVYNYTSSVTDSFDALDVGEGEKFRLMYDVLPSTKIVIVWNDNEKVKLR